MPLLVNGETVDDAAIRAEANAIRPRMMEAMFDEDPLVVESRVKEWARENVIERVLLKQAAPDGDVEALLAKVTENVARPRNKDITDYYRKHRDELIRPEMIRAAHIVRNVDETNSEDSARAAIDAAQARLAAGEPFDKVADELSDCPGRGGDLGFFARGQMVPEFESVVFAMPPGSVSPVFRSPFGFHIATVLERRDAGPARLEDVRAEIEETLFHEKRRKVIEQYLDRLRAKAEIKSA